MAEFVTSTLIDSYAGGPHVTEVQLGLANQADFGPDDYVLEGGRESEAQILTNNSIRIFDAVYCLQGRRDVVPASGYSDVTIANGAQGMNRNDIIVRRYKKDESSEIESTEYAVIKGEAVAGEAEDPEVTVGNIRSGATLHEMKLYRVKIEGLNITAVEPLFQVLKSKITLQKEIAQTNKDLVDRLKPVNITDQFSVTVGANCPLSCILESVIQCGNVIQMNGIFTKNKQGWVSGSGDVSMKILHKTEPDKYKPLSYRNPVILGALNDSKNTDLHLNYLNSGYFYGVSRVDSSSTVMQHSWQITYIMAG